MLKTCNPLFAKFFQAQYFTKVGNGATTAILQLCIQYCSYASNFHKCLDRTEELENLASWKFL